MDNKVSIKNGLVIVNNKLLDRDTSNIINELIYGTRLHWKKQYLSVVKEFKKYMNHHPLPYILYYIILERHTKLKCFQCNTHRTKYQILTKYEYPEYYGQYRKPGTIIPDSGIIRIGYSAGRMRSGPYSIAIGATFDLTQCFIHCGQCKNNKFFVIQPCQCSICHFKICLCH